MRNANDRLALGVARVAARSKNADRRAPAEQRRDQLRARRNDVLTVVDDEQHFTASEPFGDGVDERDAGPLTNAQDVSNGTCHASRLTYGGELGEPDTAREPVQQRPGDLTREGRLASAPGPSEGQQPCRFGLEANAPDQPLPPDEAAALDG